MPPAIFKCGKCRRPFSNAEEFCPKCGALSAGGKIATLLKVGSIGLTLAALSTAIFFMWRVAEQNREHPQQSGSAAPPSLPLRPPGS